MNDRSRRATKLVTALFVSAPLIVGAPAVAEPGKSKGDERPETAPGQVKPAGEPAQPQQSQRPARQEKAPQGKAKGHAKAPARVKAPKAPKPAKAPRAAKAPTKAVEAPKTAGRPAGKPAQGKTTICHATGSDTNPYVTITVANAAVAAHQRHQDGRDIVPAPAGGCPSTPAAATERDKESKAKGKTTICHATGSDTNPYVTITIANPAVAAHQRHQDGRDIIPAPAEGCPGTAATKTLPPAVAKVLEALPAPAAVVQALTSPARAQVLGETVAGGRGGVLGDRASGGRGGVLGDRASGGREQGATAPAAARRESGADGGSLPFTGLDLALVLIAGAGLLLAGFSLRRALAGRAV